MSSPLKIPTETGAVRLRLLPALLIPVLAAAAILYTREHHSPPRSVRPAERQTSPAFAPDLLFLRADRLYGYSPTTGTTFLMPVHGLVLGEGPGSELLLRRKNRIYGLFPGRKREITLLTLASSASTTSNPEAWMTSPSTVDKAWLSPDGKILLLDHEGPALGMDHVTAYRLGGGSPQNLGIFPPGPYDLHLAAWQSGRALFFQGAGGGVVLHGLHLARLSGSVTDLQAHHLQGPETGVTAAAAYPGNGSLAFAVTEWKNDANFALYLRPPAGKSRLLLRLPGETAVALHFVSARTLLLATVDLSWPWAPSYYAETGPSVSFYRVSLPAGKRQLLFTAHPTDLTWLPDGAGVVYLSGGTLRYRPLTPGSVAHTVPDGEHPTWFGAGDIWDLTSLYPYLLADSQSEPPPPPTPAVQQTAPGPAISSVMLDFPLSPDGSMSTGMEVEIQGKNLGDGVSEDMLNLRTGAGKLLASLSPGLPPVDGTAVLRWTPNDVRIRVDDSFSPAFQRWLSDPVPLEVWLSTPAGTASELVSLPDSPYNQFLLLDSRRAVAAEYFPPGTTEPDLGSLNSEAQHGFPASAAVAEAAVAGGKPDPITLLRVRNVPDLRLAEPAPQSGGLIPAGGYLLYEGRSFGDPLVGGFRWVELSSPLSPADFARAARLASLGGCTSTAGSPPCP